MREIKFRAWHKKVKKIVSWELLLKECDRFSLLYDDDFVFMQYTGLKDKNGKEIYEGDWVRNHNGQGIVTWMVNGFYLRAECGRKGTWTETGSFTMDLGVRTNEILGNVFENPELSKGEK